MQYAALLLKCKKASSKNTERFRLSTRQPLKIGQKTILSRFDAKIPENHWFPGILNTFADKSALAELQGPCAGPAKHPVISSLST